MKTRADQQRVILEDAKRRELQKKHGTPAEFASAVYSCVPSFVSTDEAATAVEKYNKKWAMP